MRGVEDTLRDKRRLAAGANLVLTEKILTNDDQLATPNMPGGAERRQLQHRCR